MIDSRKKELEEVNLLSTDVTLLNQEIFSLFFKISKKAKSIVKIRDLINFKITSYANMLNGKRQKLLFIIVSVDSASPSTLTQSKDVPSEGLSR